MTFTLLKSQEYRLAVTSGSSITLLDYKLLGKNQMLLNPARYSNFTTRDFKCDSDLCEMFLVLEVVGSREVVEVMLSDMSGNASVYLPEGQRHSLEVNGSREVKFKFKKGAKEELLVVVNTRAVRGQSSVILSVDGHRYKNFSLEEGKFVQSAVSYNSSTQE